MENFKLHYIFKNKDLNVKNKKHCRKTEESKLESGVRLDFLMRTVCHVWYVCMYKLTSKRQTMQQEKQPKTGNAQKTNPSNKQTNNKKILKITKEEKNVIQITKHLFSSQKEIKT